MTFNSSEIFLLVKAGCNTRSIFLPRSLSCLRPESADFWSLSFSGFFSFLGMVITKTDNLLNTCVYRKRSNKGLLLHHQSHVDNRYKRSLIRTMLDRANRLSSSPDLFSKECQDLKTMALFLKLKYPKKLIDTTFKRFSLPKTRTKTVLSQSTALHESPCLTT